MQLAFPSTINPNDPNMIRFEGESAMLIRNANKQGAMGALAILKQIDPDQFSNVKLKQVLGGFLIDQPIEIDMEVIRRMWVYFRNTNPIARSFGNLPPMDFSTDFINDLGSIYFDYQKIFLQFLELDESTLYFRSNIYLTSQFFLLKNFDKILTVVLTVGGELEQWQSMINKVALETFNYQGPLFVYNLFEIRQLAPGMANVTDKFENIQL